MAGALKGRLVDFSVGLNGKQRITVELDRDFRPQYEALRETDVDIDLKKHRERRSKDSNAYAWVLIDKIASATQQDKEVVYREAIRSIGGVSETVCVKTEAVERLRRSWGHNGVGWSSEIMPSKIPGCTNVILYYGSSMYDTKQMSNLIEHLIQDAKDLGIETMTPEELARLYGGEP